MDKEQCDKGLKISESDLDIFKAAIVIEELSPKVLRIKVISIVLYAKTACIRGSIKIQDWHIDQTHWAIRG